MEPSVPLAPVAAEGDPAASAHLVAGLDVPVPTGSHTTAGAGLKQPGPVVGGKPAAGPGASPEALSGAEGRKAWAKAISTKNAAQRRGRHRRSADPLRNAVPGARKMPPEPKP